MEIETEGGRKDIPICCGLLDESNYPRNSQQEKFLQKVQQETKVPHEHHACTIHKYYIPSPYEKKEMEIAWQIANLSAEAEHRDTLLEHFYADIPDSNKWLERVKVRMQAPNMQKLTTTSNIFQDLKSREYAEMRLRMQLSRKVGESGLSL